MLIVVTITQRIATISKNAQVRSFSCPRKLFEEEQDLVEEDLPHSVSCFLDH